MAREPSILLCVGAAKAGTTWLYNHLARHPDCHLRAIKELHYFDTLENGGFDRQIKVQSAFAAKLGLSAKGGSGRDAARLDDVTQWLAVLGERREDLGKYLAYLTDGRGDRRVVGEMTPAYALLPEARLRQVAGMAPDVRFIYLMRDPVARLWSHVRMLAQRASRTADAVPEQAFAILDGILAGTPSGVADRSDYKATLTRFWAAIDPSRLLVMFQEQMLTAEGWARICRFLGIAVVPVAFDKPVHVGVELTMTAEQRVRARAFLRPQYDFVARHFPDMPESWRRNMGEDL